MIRILKRQEIEIKRLNLIVDSLKIELAKENIIDTVTDKVNGGLQ